MKTVTLHRGGTLEKTVPLDSIRVPDLWHVAQWFKNNKPRLVKAGLLSEVEVDRASEAVNETWHLAHDLKKELEAQS